MTSNDWTAYYETLPADRLDLALAIEADRMVNSVFDTNETESERTVILSERQGGENNPAYLLYEEVLGTAYRAHPYRHMVIGHTADLRQIRRDDLVAHYQRYYQPNNAFITAAGDFDAENLATAIAAAFGAIPAGRLAPAPSVHEPAQAGERRVTLHRPAPTSYLRMAFHAPAARHPDMPALLLADAVLSGAKGMGFGGSGLMGRSSRLYRSLVATGLARAVGSSFAMAIDPTLFAIGVTALPTTDPAQIEEAVDTELRRLRDEEVTDRELARAKNQVRAQYVYSSEGATNQAYWLGQMEIVDDYRRADSLVDDLLSVTLDDIQRVARTYLVDRHRTVGWLLPDADGGGTATPTTRPTEPRTADFDAGPQPVLTPVSGRSRGVGAAAPLERVELPNGMVVVAQCRPSDPSVVVRFRLLSGAITDPTDREGLSHFTARMLPRGGERRSFAELNEATDDLGASLATEGNRFFVELGIRCLRDDLSTLLDLAADVLRRPTFPDEELTKVRNEILASIRESDNDTRSVADRALRRLIYPAPHPLGRRVSGDEASLGRIGPDDLRAHHGAAFGPNVTTVAIVGGFDGLDHAATLIADRFGDWSPSITPPASVTPAPVPTTPLRADIRIPGKSQADLAIGFPVPPRSSPSHYALDTANLVLGRLGLMGRLGASVRDAQGLAYYVFSQIDAGRTSGLWTSKAGIDPDNVERARDSIVAEVRRLRHDGVTDVELADAKSFLTGVLPLAIESIDGVAATLLNIEYHDLGLDYLHRYPSMINALTREDLATAWDTIEPDHLAVAVARPA